MITGALQGSFGAVSQLARIGHKTLAVVGGPLSVSNGRARLQGFKKARKANGLGFNPKLVNPAGSTLAYYGYGVGVVRMSLGDNEELGGQVRGDFVRWFFFPDATVVVNGQTLTEHGKLVDAKSTGTH